MPRPSLRRLSETDVATLLVALDVLREALDDGLTFDSFAGFFVDGDGHPVERPTVADVAWLADAINTRPVFVARAYGENPQPGDLR